MFPSNRSYGAKAAAANAKHSFKVTEQDSYKNSKKLAKETSVKNYKKSAEDAVKTRDPHTLNYAVVIVLKSYNFKWLRSGLGRATKCESIRLSSPCIPEKTKIRPRFVSLDNPEIQRHRRNAENASNIAYKEDYEFEKDQIYLMPNQNDQSKLDSG